MNSVLGLYLNASQGEIQEMFAQTRMPASQASATPDSVSTATVMVRGALRVSTVIWVVARPRMALDTPVLRTVSANQASATVDSVSTATVVV